jgi:hypothetical protein
MRDTGIPAGAERDQDRKAGRDRNEFRGAPAMTRAMGRPLTRQPLSWRRTSQPCRARPASRVNRAAGRQLPCYRRFSSPCASAQIRSYLAARLSAFESCIDERSNRIGSAGYALRECIRPSTSGTGQQVMGLRSSVAFDLSVRVVHVWYRSPRRVPGDIGKD